MSSEKLKWQTSNPPKGSMIIFEIQDSNGKEIWVGYRDDIDCMRNCVGALIKDYNFGNKTLKTNRISRWVFYYDFWNMVER